MRAVLERTLRPAQNRGGRCRDCAYFADDRAVLEASLPGFASMGSAYGATLGESRLCTRFDRFVSPRDGCESITPVAKRDRAD